MKDANFKRGLAMDSFNVRNTLSRQDASLKSQLGIQNYNIHRQLAIDTNTLWQNVNAQLSQVNQDRYRANLIDQGLANMVIGNTLTNQQSMGGLFNASMRMQSADRGHLYNQQARDDANAWKIYSEAERLKAEEMARQMSLARGVATLGGGILGGMIGGPAGAVAGAGVGGSMFGGGSPQQGYSAPLQYKNPFNGGQLFQSGQVQGGFGGQASQMFGTGYGGQQVSRMA